VVTSHHKLYYPAQVAVLDASSGNLLREYFHPGHLNAITTGVYQGREVVFLGGTNNAHHSATLVVLDPDRMDGAAVEKGVPIFEGFKPGVEEARLLFSRSCLNASEPYNMVARIVSGEKELVVDLHENLSPPEQPSILYHFGPELELKDVSVSDVFRRQHDKLSNHPFTAAELIPLRKITRLP